MSDASLRMPESSPSPKVRKFGRRASDLDLAISAKDRVGAAVAVVVRYSDLAYDETEALDWAWSLPIGLRVLQLLKVVRCSQDDADLVLFQKCPESGCGEKLELPLPLEALITHGEEALAQGDRFTCELEGSREISFRRATGRDQLNWKASRFANQQEANRALMETLVVDGGSTVEEQDDVPLSEAIREVDPLVSFQLATECPACQKKALISVDIEKLCLNQLRKIQAELLKAVHRLASAYGWTEKEILGLSTKRRNAYLDLVEVEGLA